METEMHSYGTLLTRVVTVRKRHYLTVLAAVVLAGPVAAAAYPSPPLAPAPAIRHVAYPGGVVDLGPDYAREMCARRAAGDSWLVMQADTMARYRLDQLTAANTLNATLLANCPKGWR